MVLTSVVKELTSLVYNLPHKILFNLPFVEISHKQFIHEQIRAHIQHVEKTYLKDMSQIEIMLYTIVLYMVVRWLHKFIKFLRKLTFERVKIYIFRLALYIPQVKKHIDKESDETAGKVA